MDESPHCAISGDAGALEFAPELACNPTALKGNEFPAQHVRIANTDYGAYYDYIHRGEPVKESRSDIVRPPGRLEDVYDTASAVAMDAQGNLACALSTGKYSVQQIG